eukprot:scaffold25604_cov20-Tisochrysis_lutea.AAC.1
MGIRPFCRTYNCLLVSSSTRADFPKNACQQVHTNWANSLHSLRAFARVLAMTSDGMLHVHTTWPDDLQSIRSYAAAHHHQDSNAAAAKCGNTPGVKQQLSLTAVAVVGGSDG